MALIDYFLPVGARQQIQDIGGVSTVADIPGTFYQETGISGLDPTAPKVSETAPWGPQQEYLKDIFGQAQQIYGTGAPLTPEFSPETQQYFQAIQERAAAGSPVQQQGAETLSTLLGGSPYLTGTAGGEFLNKNPYLDETFNRASEAVKRQFGEATANIGQNFAMGGRYTGGRAKQEAIGGAERQLGEQLGGLATDIYGGAYESERDRMLRAAGLLGQQQLGATGQALDYAGQDWRDIMAGGIPGQQIDIRNQQVAQEPWKRLGLYRDIVGGNYGGTTKQPGKDVIDVVGGLFA